MAQTRTKKPAPKQRVETTEETKPGEHITTEDIDAMLDEIDDVLEKNAEEFVRNYVQKGGQ